MKSNHPNIEDGNEWLNIWVNIHFTENSIPGIRSGELTDESKKAILSYIQSNYILKSDVEDFIKDILLDGPPLTYTEHTEWLNAGFEACQNMVMQKASQYGLTKSDIIE